jgi:protein-L-isoaspartate(D-aspartate) O-methyltransferase
MEPQTTLEEGAAMADAATRYESARKAMVKRQLMARDITDARVLEAMGRVPRERFVPPGRRPQAYSDGAMAIGQGQTISQPYMVALMTQALALDGSERVLEIGTGSGYQTAILAELARQVYTIERIPSLSEAAEGLLVGELGYGNITFEVGDGTTGWPLEGPFDGIIVTAGAPRKPIALLAQLAPEGRAVAPVGGRHSQSLMRYERQPDGEVTEEFLCGCVFVKLIGEDGWD